MIIGTDSTTVHFVRLQLRKSLVQAFSFVLALLHLKLILAEHSVVHTLHIDIITLLLRSQGWVASAPAFLDVTMHGTATPNRKVAMWTAVLHLSEKASVLDRQCDGCIKSTVVVQAVFHP